MAFEGPGEDRLAIRERIEAYGDAVFRHDADDWIACWTQDATWSLPGFEVKGREPMRAAWTQAMAAFDLAAFFCVPGAISVRGDAASARVYTQEVLVDLQGARRLIVGAYEDDLVREGGAWLFGRRSYRILEDRTEPKAP